MPNTPTITDQGSSPARVRFEHSYRWSVSSALQAGRDDLAAELADDYGRETGMVAPTVDETKPGQGPRSRNGKRRSGGVRRLVARRRPALKSMNRYAARVVNPPARLARRARRQGPLSY